MVAMGLVPMGKDSLGFEATGVITRVGSAVERFKPGDKVFGVGVGLFATRKTVPSQSLAKLPEGFTFEEVVTMPVVYATVIYCLFRMGQLEEGQVCFSQLSLFQPQSPSCPSLTCSN